MSDQLDVIVKGGEIVDGTGKDGYTADLGILGDRIAAIGDLGEAEAATVIDATGKHVTPGFIDPHSHGDLNILFWPGAEAYTMQGVTTIVGGNCGYTPAPLREVWPFTVWETDVAYEVQPGYFSYVHFQLDLEKSRQAIKTRYGIEVDWTTFGEYLDKVEGHGSSINLCPFVGHGAIRSHVMGFDVNRPATEAEIAEMRDLVRDALEAGAFGMGTGLDYPPGGFAPTEEVIALVRAAGESGGMYETHFRSTNLFTGGQGQHGVLDGIEEALRIGREAGVRVQLSHMLPGYKVRPDGSEIMGQAVGEATVAAIEKGAADGVEVAYDVLPTTGLTVFPYLIFLLRPWLLQAGSVEQLLKNLAVPDFVAHLKEDVARGAWMMLSSELAKDFAPDIGMMYEITQSENPAYVGRSLYAIGQENGTDSLDALFTVIREDPSAKMTMVLFSSDELIRALLDHPLAMPSSDGFCCDEETSWGLPEPLNMLPHSNNYCYAVRYLTRYPRQRFEDGIRQMTGWPAEWFGIRDRGVLAEGAFADVVVLDRAALETNEDDVEPRRYPGGIDHVLVNGTIVRDGSSHTGARAGRVLRRDA